MTLVGRLGVCIRNTLDFGHSIFRTTDTGGVSEVAAKIGSASVLGGQRHIINHLINKKIYDNAF